MMTKEDYAKKLVNFQGSINAFPKDTSCPRCLQGTLEQIKTHNSLSRVREGAIYVCNSCGTAEAMNDMFGIANTVETWEGFKFVNQLTK